MHASDLYSSTICFYEPLFTIAGSPETIRKFFESHWNVTEYQKRDGGWRIRIDWPGTEEVPAQPVMLKLDEDGEMIFTNDKSTPALFTVELVKQMVADFPETAEQMWFLSHYDACADYQSGISDQELLLRVSGEIDDGV